MTEDVGSLERQRKGRGKCRAYVAGLAHRHGCRSEAAKTLPAFPRSPMPGEALSSSDLLQ